MMTVRNDEDLIDAIDKNAHKIPFASARSSHNTVEQQILTRLKTAIEKISEWYFVCGIWVGLHFAFLEFRWIW